MGRVHERAVERNATLRSLRMELHHAQTGGPPPQTLEDTSVLEEQSRARRGRFAMRTAVEAAEQARVTVVELSSSLAQALHASGEMSGEQFTRLGSQLAKTREAMEENQRQLARRAEELEEALDESEQKQQQLEQLQKRVDTMVKEGHRLRKEHAIEVAALRVCLPYGHRGRTR